MKLKNKVITIRRECGSGGHTIGTLLSEKLGIPFYDKKIIELVVSKSGLSEETVTKNGEYATRGILSNSPFGVSPIFRANDRNMLSLHDQVSAYRAEIIRELADKEPCIIIGRGADYLLRDRTDCLHVFIYGRTEDKIRRVITEHHIPENEAASHIKNRDKKRAKNYANITDREWGNMQNYHLCLDSSRLGIDQCVEIIMRAYLDNADDIR